MAIPNKLRDPSINFVLIGKKDKRPFEKEWQNKEIKWDDPRLIEHLENGGNYGVLGGGDKKLVIVDFDNEIVQQAVCEHLPDTFTVKTGSGLLHKYFYCDNDESFKVLDKEKRTIADIQGKGKQCVGPGSVHPNGNIYILVENNDIATISLSELKALFEPYNEVHTKTFKSLLNENVETDDFLLRLKKLLPVEKVLREWDIDTQKNPTDCPFHDSVGGKCFSYKDEIWHCFHCEESGNIFHLIMKYTDCNFEESVDFLCKMAGIENEKVSPQEISEQVRKDNLDINLIWDKDLQSHEEEKKNWLIDKLIPRKSVGVWTGKRGTFKTFLVLNAAYCVSSGKDFLGIYKTEKSKVLYLDKENGLSIIQERSRMIKKGLELEEDVDLGFICFSQVKLDKNVDFWALEEIIEKEGIELLVIDTYRRAISFDENDAGNVSRLFVDFLRPLVEKHDVSVVLIHHNRKGHSEGDEMDMLRGSSDLANYCDFILQNDRKNINLILKQLKLRNAPEQQPIAVNLETDETTYMTFKSSGTYEPKTQEQLASDTIIEWATDSGIKEFSTKEVQDKAFSKGIKRQSLFDAINNLLDLGILIKLARGRYKIDLTAQS